MKDKGLIENIRIIAEFIIYIEKYNKTEMFEILKSSLILDTIVQILKTSQSLKVKQQILQTINILIQNIASKDRLRKFPLELISPFIFISLQTTSWSTRS